MPEEALEEIRSTLEAERLADETARMIEARYADKITVDADNECSKETVREKEVASIPSNLVRHMLLRISWAWLTLAYRRLSVVLVCASEIEYVRDFDGTCLGGQTSRPRNITTSSSPLRVARTARRQ